MPVIFKQNFDAFNQEFDEYLELLIQRSDSGFCAEVQLFARQLIAYMLKIRVTQGELPDFEVEVEEGESPASVLIAGRLSLLAAKMLAQSIEERLDGDFPKFTVTKTNFWRYLVRFVPVYMGEVSPDYTKEFTVATACLLELNFYCIRIRQLYLVENFKIFWIAMFLHFFGERFRGRGRCAFLEDLKLQEAHEKMKVDIQSLEIVVKVEVTKKAKEEGENNSKKSRKKNRKRHK